MRMFQVAPLMRRNDGLADVFGEFERVFDTFARGFPLAEGGAAGALAPRLDVAETKDGLEIKADLPGVKESDIDVQLDGKVLSIKAQREEVRESKDKTWHVAERSSGSFARVLTLPFTPENDKVEATFADGVLHLHLPKPDAAKIEVKKVAVKGVGKK
ncbi:MAG: Hsp20/alpha crystallin family protein [Proteobacteria bacterium]|nr:Hsp20/alpha crystallin family protein [Pseudomonadota bacterium]NBX86420.1 Hsp20/alpha crystallin family protein [Pseudomonadota bacterium]